MSAIDSKSSKPKRHGQNGGSSTSSEKSTLGEAIDRLEEADDWEDSSVNIHVEVPKNSHRPAVVKVFSSLPPWGRVVVACLVLALVYTSGLAKDVAAVLVKAFSP